MSEDIKFTVDTDKVNLQLKEHRMKTAESRRAIRNGLSTAGQIIRNAARRNLATVSGKDGKIHSSPLRRFVKSKVYKDLGGVRVDILGGSLKRERESMEKKKIKDLAFTLKFFELGTKERFNKRRKKKGLLKKNRYTGYIRSSYFFQRAVQSKSQEAQEKLQDILLKQIERIAKRRK